jgi:hypothetical protein
MPAISASIDSKHPLAKSRPVARAGGFHRTVSSQPVAPLTRAPLPAPDAATLPVAARFGHGTQPLVLAALLACGPASRVHADIQTVNLDFATSNQSMWGTGAALTADLTTSALLFPISQPVQSLVDPIAGVGIHLATSIRGQIGFEPKFHLDSGSVGVSYPLQVGAILPKTVAQGATFNIDTSSFLNSPSLLQTASPEAHFTLDAIMKLNVGVEGAIYPPGMDPQQINPPIFHLDYSHNLVDVGTGGLGFTLPIGPYGTLSASIPEQLATSSSTLIPAASRLPTLQSSASGADRFLDLGLDLDAMAVTAFGLPPSTFGDAITFVPDGDGDGSPDLSLEYELLNVEAHLGLKLAQEFTFVPTAVNVTMTSSTGESHQGKLGDIFTFAAPDAAGEVTIDAEFSLTGELRNRTGFVVNGALNLEAGKLVLHNELGADFELNFAQTLGLGSDFLVSGEIPEGGFDVGAPVYLFDSTFQIEGFETQTTTFLVEVIPEPSLAVLAGLGAVASACVRRRQEGPAAAGLNCRW